MEISRPTDIHIETYETKAKKLVERIEKKLRAKEYAIKSDDEITVMIPDENPSRGVMDIIEKTYLKAGWRDAKITVGGRYNECDMLLRLLK